MCKIMFATLLAAGLLAAPLQQNSSAAFAQQSKASEKTAKTKTEPAPANLPRANARRNVQMNGKKRKPPARRQRPAEILERLQQAAQGRHKITRQNFFSALSRPQQKLEGVGETRSLGDALICHSEPGRRGATALRSLLHDAHRPV